MHAGVRTVRERKPMRCDLYILAITLMLLASALGCQSDSSKPDARASAAPVKIEDATWQLAEVDGKPAEPVAADERAAHFRLSAADKRVSGYSGINAFSGPYELNGALLKFGMLAMTRRAGPEPLMRQESAFTRALENTTLWTIVGGPDSIELHDAAGKPLAQFTRVTGTGG